MTLSSVSVYQTPVFASENIVSETTVNETDSESKSNNTVESIDTNVITEKEVKNVIESNEEDSKSFNVQLKQTEHGTISFKDVEGETTSFKQGEKCIIDIAPEKGYYANNIEVKKAGEDYILQQADGIQYTLIVPDADTEVLVTFEKGNPDDATVQENYIADNMNSTVNKKEGSSETKTDIEYNNYEASDLEDTGHTVYISYTLADSETIGNSSVNDILEGNESLMGVYEDTANVYKVSEESDYYVAFIDITKINKNAKIIGTEFADTDTADPENLNNVVKYDKTKGILYIPKSYYFNDIGVEIAHGVRAQLIYSYDIENDNTTNIAVTIENENGGVIESCKTGTITGDTLDFTTTVKISEEETARKISLSDLSVYLNGENEEIKLYNYETEDQAASAYYDNKTGELTILTSPFTLSSIKVVIHKRSIIKTVSDAIENTIIRATNAATYKVVSNPDDLGALPGTKLTSIDTNSLVEGSTYSYPNAEWIYVYYDYHWQTVNTYSALSCGYNTFKYCYVLGHNNKVIGNSATDDADKTSKSLTNKLSGKGDVTWSEALSGQSVVKANGTPSDTQMSRSYNFIFTPPHGTLKRSGSKGPATVNFGGLSEWAVTVNSKNPSNYKDWHARALAAHCSHAGKSNTMTTKDGTTKRGFTKKSSYVHILKVNTSGSSPYMIFGLVGPTTGVAHQTAVAMYKVRIENPVEPVYAVPSGTRTMTVSENFNVNIFKTDSQTRQGLAGAVFNISCNDGYGTTNFSLTTGNDGKVSKVVSRSYGTVSASSSEIGGEINNYKYVTNYSQLSTEKQNQVRAGGYYLSADEAQRALNSRLDAILNVKANSLKQKTYTWTIKETTAPNNYLLNGKTYTITESSTDSNGKTISVNVSNDEKTLKARIYKYNTDNDQPLSGAVFELYAAEDIKKFDKKTTAYAKDQLIESGISIGSDGYGSVSANLYPGKYYFKETKMPKGFYSENTDLTFTINDNMTGTANVSITSPDSKTNLATISVPNKPIRANVQVYKVYEDVDDETITYPESGAQFVIYNAITGEQVGPILTTDANGITTSEMLDEGSYILHQKSGIAGHKRIDDISFNVNLNVAGSTIPINIVNEKMETRIMISKKSSQESLDGTLTVKNESGIRFIVTAKEDIHNDEGNLVYSAGDTVETLITDENGYAESGILPGGTYTVTQETGVQDKFHTDFVEVEPYDITLDENNAENVVYMAYDYARSFYINISKTMTDIDDNNSIEENAVFYVLDGNDSALKTIFNNYGYVTNENITSGSAETRTQIIADIKSVCPDAILDTIITDDTGKATYKGLPSQLEDNYPDDDFLGGILVFHAKGEAGYTFAPIQHITDSTTPTSVDTETRDAIFYYDEDDNKHVAGKSYDISTKIFDLDLNDKFDDFGYIKIYKDYQKDATDYAHEEGAQFEISQDGTVIDTITIGSDGYGISKKLLTGKYSVEQIKQGDDAKNHLTVTFIDDIDVRRVCSSSGGLYSNPNSEEDGQNITYVEYADDLKHEIVILAGNNVPYTETIGVIGNMTVVLADTSRIQTGILDKARPVYAYLYKASSSTGALLNNAGFILSKYNETTGQYEDIIDETDGEARVYPSGYDEDGNKDDGRVSFGLLEYGKYKVRESSAPSHYLLNDTEYFFELDSETPYTKVYKTTCSKCGYIVPANNTNDICPDCGRSLVDKYFYQITPVENPTTAKDKLFYNTPRYGRIGMTKVGDKLVGKTTSSNGSGFYWDSKPVANATYNLYAENNIYTYDSVIEYTYDAEGNITSETLISGTLLYQKDDLVASGVTDANGYIQFKRPGNTTADAILPDDLTLLPLGDYYAKEVISPAPFILDEEKHPISISDNMEASQLPPGDIDDEGNMDDQDLDKYNYALFLSDNSLRFVYSSVKYKAGDTYINGASSYTVTAAWYSDDHNNESGSGYILDEYTSPSEVPWAAYRSQITKVVVADEIQPNYTSYWFYNFENCTDMDLLKLDTLAVQKMSYMFCYCSGLTTLDLTSFDTRNVTDMQYMFYFCTNLTTIYASENFVTTRLNVPDNSSFGFSSIGSFLSRLFMKNNTINNSLANMIVRVNAAPIDSLDITEVKCNKLSFDLNETIRYSDFDFTFNDSSSNYVITSGSINPSTNRFADPGKYAVSGEINVMDTTTNDTVRLTFTCPDVLVLDKTIPDVIESNDNEFEDINPKIQASVHKEGYDKDDPTTLLYDYMPGATFSLFANVDILDEKGNILFKKDQEICRQVTEQSLLIFDNLPSDHYAAENVKYMYYIVETGLRNSDTHIIVPTITSDDIVIDTSKNLGDSDNCPYIKYMISADATGATDPEVVLPEILVQNITSDQNINSYDIQKIWDDEENRDKIRPSKVYVALYCTNKPDDLNVSYLKKDTYSDGYIYNGSGGGIIELNEDNSWHYRIDNVINTYDITDLDIYSEWSSTEEGRKILQEMITENGSSEFELYYEWREYLYDENNSPYTTEGSVINGNENTGYTQFYAPRTEGDIQFTTLTNRHISDTNNIKVVKRWNDNNNEKGIRPETIDVILYRQLEGDVNATEFDRATLSAAGGSSDNFGAQTEAWTYCWMNLPRSENQKEITYFVREVMDESKYLTGESIIGYAASYDEPENMDEQNFYVTTITNTTTHQYGTYVASKKIKASNIDFTKGNPKFTFTLTGYDVYGQYHSYSHEFEFTKDYVDANTDENGFVTMTYTFSNLEYGTYTLTENGEEVTYELVEVK